MRSKLWTDDQIALLKELYPQEDVSTEYLQQLLGRSQKALHHKALALGLRRPSIVWTQHQITLLKQMYPDPAISKQDMERALNRDWIAIKIKANKLQLFRPNRNKYKANRRYFQILNTPIKAYLLGLLAADGAIDHKKGQHRVILMLQFRDKVLVDRFRDEIAPNIPIMINRNTYSVCISSKEMCEDLAVYGIGPRKSTRLRWPDSLPQDLVIPFILGYFDGDGTLCQVNNKGRRYWRWELLGCHDFLAVVKQHIEHFARVPLSGPVRADKNRSPHLYRIYTGSQQAITRIDAVLNASGLGLPRKHFSSSDGA
jgi:hypothetical protein